jgi:uncharacterized protein (TIGR02466 family)|tara:strand:- start:1850 stop:2449 length:600 start_codon:yes stop_codon:yes gene_type:complete
MINSLFSTQVYGTNLNLDVKAMIPECYHLQKTTESEKQSNQGGFQSKHIDPQKYKHPLFHELADEILKHACIYGKAMGFKEEFMPYLKMQMWININKPQAFNNPHVHLGSLFSGVYYLKASDMTLGFENPNKLTPYAWHFHEHIFHDTASTAETCFVETIDNKIYIFPCWLTHFVLPNRSNEDRISISFDVTLPYHVRP